MLNGSSITRMLTALMHNWNGNDQYNRNPYWDLYKNNNTSAKDVFRFTAKAIYT